MLRGMKSPKVAGTAGAIFALAVVWIGFQVATNGHTGILRRAAEAKEFLGKVSIPQRAVDPKKHAAAESQHHVTLTWKASTTPGTRYNVYRRGLIGGLARLNAVPISDTSYIDNSVQPGQTYFYTTRAASSAGAESKPSNEVRVDVPSP
jgi:hypothetical protein